MERTWAYRVVIVLAIIFIAVIAYTIVRNRISAPQTPSIIERIQNQSSPQ